MLKHKREWEFFYEDLANPFKMGREIVQNEVCTLLGNNFTKRLKLLGFIISNWKGTCEITSLLNMNQVDYMLLYFWNVSRGETKWIRISTQCQSQIAQNWRWFQLKELQATDSLELFSLTSMTNIMTRRS